MAAMRRRPQPLPLALTTVYLAPCLPILPHCPSSVPQLPLITLDAPILQVEVIRCVKQVDQLHVHKKNSVYCVFFIYLLQGCLIYLFVYYQELERHGRTMRLPSIPERTIKFQRVEIQPGEEPLPIS